MKPADISSGKEGRVASDREKEGGENVQNKKRKRKKNRKKNLKAKIFATAVVLTASVGLFFMLLYAFGGARLRASAETSSPDVSLMTQEDTAEEIRKAAGLETVQWQEDWIALDGKVYSYDDSCINLLVLGIDKEGKLSGEADYEKWKAGQADAIFVVSINPTEEEINILGIPRNTMMDIDVYDKESHVAETLFDAACLQYPYAGGGKSGLEVTKEKVSALLYGLPLHGAFAVGYDAVAVVNDMAGGVDVTALETLNTPYGNYEEGEKLHLEGEFVLAYVKARNMEILGSPTMRLERQKQYLTALLAKVKEEVRKNPAAVGKMYSAVSEYMVTDVTLDKAVYLAAQAAGYQFDGSAVRLLQGEDKAAPIMKDGVETGDYYNEYYLDEESLKRTMTEVFYTEVVLGGQE